MSSFGLCHSLLMDLGQDQQQQPTVHSAIVEELVEGGSVTVAVDVRGCPYIT